MAQTQTVPLGTDDEDDVRSRTTLRLDEDMHFRLKWTAVVLKMSMQECIKEALGQWLDRKVGAVQDVIKQSSHKIAPSQGSKEATGS